ncbi:tetratricopeptide repeat protein [Bifidobacterium sp. ESL0790]|uniref:tetratricopeptide repeat protein n=1 Tax=Bifidobacterium sp. ESL0790 TaxID=2983233 RepID=UPI0023F64A38|nr:tetratricopeptide repeat protein [Bifidobacterium sp. ESL0790]WEV71826.1 tetratricopeptide repeat protein [Bifidobacterium sp. ESL0790]
MSHFFSHARGSADSSGKHDFLDRLGRVANHLNVAFGTGVEPFHSHGKLDQPGDAGEVPGEAVVPPELKLLMDQTMELGPLVKCQTFHFDGVPDGIELGWAQLPQLGGRFFSLGVFVGRRGFCQVALADGKGRVFPGSDPQMDTHDMDAALVLGKEGDFLLHDDSRLVRGLASAAGSDDMQDGGDGNESRYGRGRNVSTMQGGIVGRDMFGRMTWLASWLRHGDRYTLEQMRYPLPEDMRIDLDYRDAVAIAFFAAYMLPGMSGQLIGFGAGNIFRRLNREAPLGAIRRSVHDTQEARAHGLRVSGLEDYFADLMRESGALKESSGLEAVHGAEPLHLYTSSYSGNYFFTWDDSLNLTPALEALNIEGNLNRFASVSGWLERNARVGAFPIEDTVTRAQAAQIDHKLLDNPALMALNPGKDGSVSLDESSTVSMRRLLGLAAGIADDVARHAPGEDSAQPGTPKDKRGEWIYRQSVATLLRRLKLPYRFDTEFRSNLKDGNVAVSFTTAGKTMMPTSRFDVVSRAWKTLSDAERTEMSAKYNLRVGLIIAALCFGADESVENVSIRIDSMGLEEAVAQQDSAISKLIAQALGAFERAPKPNMGAGGSKADPKDGDIHGDPMQSGSMPVRAEGDVAAMPLHSADTPSGTSENRGAAEDQHSHASDAADTNKADMPDASVTGTGDDSSGVNPVQNANTTNPQVTQTGTDDTHNGNADFDSDDDDEEDDALLNARFEDLMKGVDLDSVAMSVPQGGQSSQASMKGDEDGQSDQGEDTDDPLAVLRSGPTTKTLATVTFSRGDFLERMRAAGLSHPEETYERFGATLDIAGFNGLNTASKHPQFTLRDKRFSPLGSQEEPELSDQRFSGNVAKVLGTDAALGLSIQRADLMQRAVDEFHRIAADTTLESPAKAQRAMDIVNSIGDPELTELASDVSKALIDGVDTPDLDFTLSKRLDGERLKARDLLFSGQVDQAIDSLERAVADLDERYAGGGAARYFNSYAERVVYNRLFATRDERTVLIPDNLFYAHMELADVLAQLRGAKAALPHLNKLVAYAPAYPLSHLRLAVQLAREEDWNSARAACLNALRVSLDRDDAAYAYYRLAYAEWMCGRFDVAAACYIMSEHIAPGKIASLDGELQELLARAQSQCILVPTSFELAQQVLESHGLPVWPHTEVADIVRRAARVCVDGGMFVPARTLSVAAARMDDGADEGMDMAQAQFLRSLSA